MTPRRLLEEAGFNVRDAAEAHLCCGSAGTYSLLQPEISAELHDRKLAALREGGPQCIATANIGCLAHLQGGNEDGGAPPVRHWIELLDEAVRGREAKRQA